VKTIHRAWDLEEQGQPGSSLAWFLKAQKLYPPSNYARDGIERMVAIIFPDTES